MNKFKEHWNRNKKMYYGFGGGVVITTLGAVILHKIVLTQQLVESAVATGNIMYKSNIYQTVLNARGHPGYIIECLETGLLFQSQNQAAKLLGISASLLSSHLNGKTESVNGLHFIRRSLAEYAE